MRRIRTPILFIYALYARRAFRTQDIQRREYNHAKPTNLNEFIEKSVEQIHPRLRFFGVMARPPEENTPG
jgi:hypothetical protein